LCVAALGGAPGIFSARYFGENATDELNNAKLLAELGTTPLTKRGAYYICYAVLASPTGEIAFEVEGRCHGRVLFEGRGTNGFGYDPLFEIVEYHRTFGELGPAVKRCLSHRARALREVLPRLAATFG
jgi:XTP/dITP diphosphohydrolase